MERTVSVSEVCLAPNERARFIRSEVVYCTLAGGIETFPYRCKRDTKLLQVINMLAFFKQLIGSMLRGNHSLDCNIWGLEARSRAENVNILTNCYNRAKFLWQREKLLSKFPKQERVELGPGGIFVKPLGIGTWAWGDRVLWDYGKGGFSDEDLRAAFDFSIEAGVTLFDTAEVYGSGQSERLLGKFINESDQIVFTASKFMPYPWRLRGKSLLNALRNSLERMGLEKIDLYQIHWPMPPVPIERWMDAMAQAVDEELIGDVGVSNYSVEQTIRAHKALQKYDIPLVSNQVEYSLANRKVERDGLLQVCDELNVKVIAYSPLAQGLLTGKYRVGKQPGGLRGRRVSRTKMEQIDRMVEKLKEMGNRYIDRTPAQVALNWAIQKGTIPIAGVKNLRQAKENLGALGWSLYDQDMAELDALGM